MGLHNILIANTRCPRCKSVNSEVKLYFGNRNQDRYELYKATNLGLPISNATGSAWVDCNACNRDYFVRVGIIGNIISNVEVDYLKAPYTPDDCLNETIYDHFEGKRKQADVLVFEKYSIAVVRFDDNDTVFYNIRLIKEFSKDEPLTNQLHYPIFKPIEDYFEMERRVAKNK